MIVHHPFYVHFGGMTISGFGIAIALGFLIGAFITHRVLTSRGHDASIVGDITAVSIVGFVLGAKAYYALLAGDWWVMFARGGFVYWGGWIGGVAAVWGLLYWKRVPFMRCADAAGIGIMAGYAVGRTGCWAVGDDYGRPWSGPLAVRFPEGAPPSTVTSMVREFGITPPPGASPETLLAVHPTQLYETALGFAMFLILWRLRNHSHAEGWLFGVYLVLAGSERFVIEFLRVKDDRLLGPFTLAQLIGVMLVVVGLLVMAAHRRVTKDAPGIQATFAGQ